jgi:hypothetical protein
MYPYESEAICRTIITDRIREADHRRLVREIRQSESGSNIGAASASTHRRSRLWQLVHFSHAYG